MPVMSSVGRFLARALLAIIAVVGLLLVVNAFDEDLRPETRRVLEPASDLQSADNGYFVIVGFHAPSGEKPHEHGQRMLADYAAAGVGQRRDIAARCTERRSRPS